MRRSFVFYLHSFAGLLSGIFVLLMSLSGSVLVFHEELDRLQYPRITQAEGSSLSIDAAYRSLQRQYPHARVNSVSLPETTGDPYLFTINDSSYFSGMLPLQVFLHPQNGTVIHTRGGSKDARGNVMGWLGAFHNSFHLKKTGEWLLGFFAVVFCLSLITGLILYRRSIAQVLLFRKQAYSRDHLHQVIGVYALLFNLMIGITGFWMQRYVFKVSFYQSFPPYKAALHASPPLPFSIDSASANMRLRYTDFTPYVIYFPRSSSGKTVIYGSRRSNAFIHSKKFADAVFLDSAGAVASTAFVNEVRAQDRYDIINSQVHFGRYGGWPVKVLYSLFGLIGGLLSITGSMLWLRRRKRHA